MCKLLMKATLGPDQSIPTTTPSSTTNPDPRADLAKWAQARKLAFRSDYSVSGQKKTRRVTCKLVVGKHEHEGEGTGKRAARIA